MAKLWVLLGLHIVQFCDCLHMFMDLSSRRPRVEERLQISTEEIIDKRQSKTACFRDEIRWPLVRHDRPLLLNSQPYNYTPLL
jgi:hypothetical protein